MTIKASVCSWVLGAALATSPVSASEYVGDFCFRVQLFTADIADRGDEEEDIVSLPDDNFIFVFKLAAHFKGISQPAELYDIDGLMIDLLNPNELHRVEMTATGFGGQYFWKGEYLKNSIDKNLNELIYAEGVQSQVSHSIWTTDSELNGEVTAQVLGFYDNVSGAIINFNEYYLLLDQTNNIADYVEQQAAYNEIVNQYSQIKTAHGTVVNIPCSEFPEL